MRAKLLITLAFISTVSAAAHASPVALEADEGLTIQGHIVYKDIAIPETREVGYVELTIQEDGTGKRFVFRDEDRTCVMLPVLACEREATRLKYLEPGRHVRVHQKQSYWTGRKSFALELLIDEGDASNQ